LGQFGGVVFYVVLVSYQRKVGEWFFPELAYIADYMTVILQWNEKIRELACRFPEEGTPFVLALYSMLASVCC
jgi:hypothetical protein